MIRRRAVTAAACLAAPWPLRMRAQTRARRIGVIYPGVDPGGPPPGAAAAWKKLGWILGETLLIERRYASWRLERMPELIDDLLRRHGAEVLVAFGVETAFAAARATRSVPIVFVFAYLPIEGGLIDSYARPGRNVTGMAIQSLETSTKQYEVLRGLAPQARRFALLTIDQSQYAVSATPVISPRPTTLAAAKSQGFDVSVHVAKSIESVDAALDEAVAARAEVTSIAGIHYIPAAARVSEVAMRQRWVSSTHDGLLFSAASLPVYYGIPDDEGGRMVLRSLEMVDRILRGANPADIPVELPTRYELVLNLKATRALGLKVPQSVALRVDRMIE